ncbi:MAG: DNA adenine methylase [Turicibacter sp.]|nr:DNA adenine methylase [Turicibacter sp.]
MKFYSPLRYPGGKVKLYPLIKLLISRANLENATYIEPFAGGAGVAMSLLMDGTAEKVIINDLDKGIYSFWRAVKTSPKALIKMIIATPVTLTERKKQLEIYKNVTKYSIELAFACLFLNRVNRSGIITASPIGGQNQDGRWKLDDRFNKCEIIERIANISRKKDAITIYNQDILTFLEKYLPKNGENAFVYFDPPYYKQGGRLYKQSLNHDDHISLSKAILKQNGYNWALTYDDVAEIRELYPQQNTKQFDLNYTLANKGKTTEIMVCSSCDLYPTDSEMSKLGIKLNLR